MIVELDVCVTEVATVVPFTMIIASSCSKDKTASAFVGVAFRDFLLSGGSCLLLLLLDDDDGAAESKSEEEDAVVAFFGCWRCCSWPSEEEATRFDWARNATTCSLIRQETKYL